MVEVTVEAEGEGWRVSSSVSDHASQWLRSGAQAERAAKALGRNVAEAGQDVKIVIRLRNGQIAGSILMLSGLPDLALAG